MKPPGCGATLVRSVVICGLLIMHTMIPTQATEGVVLLHGLARTPRSMARIERDLTQAGYVVVNLPYPSRKAPIEALSEGVFDRIRESALLRDCTRVHFVTHSMGGIVLRDMVSKHRIERLGRVVMLGPPNQGSELVDRLGSWRLFRWINGPAGQQLGTGPDSLPGRLGPVDLELGVIAGDRSINWINSGMIPGADDGKVSVERTKIAGMKDHLVVHTTHPTMLFHRTVISAVRRFLRTGTFREPASTAS
jgi:pimeloyl-ACP methyl ester carboxylesterase